MVNQKVFLQYFHCKKIMFFIRNWVFMEKKSMIFVENFFKINKKSLILLRKTVNSCKKCEFLSYKLKFIH